MYLVDGHDILSPLGVVWGKGIAPGCGQDGVAAGPQQGDVLHDHLPADLKAAGQLVGGNGGALLLQNLQNGRLPRKAPHRQPSFPQSGRMFFMEMSRMGAEWVRAPLEM